MNWGIWGARFSENDYLQMIQSCVDAGVTTFDHADIYGHYTVEEEFGKALSLSQNLRSQIQIITKCGINLVTPNRPSNTIKYYDTSKEHILQSVDNSLRNLGTDYLDVLLLHRPDPLMNPHEVAETFTMLKESGKVLQFGVSNFNESQTSLICKFFPIKYNQIEISVLKLSGFTNGTLDQCIKEDITPLAWSPLGGGKFFDDDDERNKKIIAVADYLAEKYNASVDQILLAWLFKHPSGIVPVLGTVKPIRIQRAMDAIKINLTTEEWYLLWRASTGNELE